MRISLVLLVAMPLLGCKKPGVAAEASACYPYSELRRAWSVTDAPVVVRLSGGLFTGAQLIAGNGTAWGACNLPDALKRDSLTLYVSGYFLTSPELERMNLTPVPFEVTSARAR